MLLNPELFQELKLRFGQVRVQARGEKWAYRPVPGGDRVETMQAGEQYTVCCPKCYDTRFRLNISHMWGQPNPVNGRPMYHLAQCFNERCDWSDLRNELDFRAFSLTGPSIAGVDLSVEEDAPEQTGTYMSPGKLVGLRGLSQEHPAIAYLGSRGFDPEVIGAHPWKVRWCPVEGAAHRWTGNRLIIPVEDLAGDVVGWQSRRITDDKEDGPKYWFMPGIRSKQRVYNLRHCQDAKRLVLYEGVTNVWACPLPSVAVFGCTVSLYQERLLCQTVAEELYVALDVEEDPLKREKIDQQIDRMAWSLKSRFRILRVEYPPGRDGADYAADPETNREIILSANEVKV